jgi:diguanylate cyclase (GGDEF)-like protein
MIFTVCVTEEELQEPQWKMLIDSVLVLLCVMAGYLIITVSVIKAMVKLMYTDTMTKVGNKSAYAECTDTLYKRIKYNENFSFSVVVIDINDLKKTNDTYGHECGDILIQNAASVIKNVWDRKYVYRIGGDEFAVVCLDIEKETMEKQMQMLEKEIDNFNCNKDDDVPFLQMAAGMSSYNYETDKEYMDVFRRADEAMYENKRMKKNKGKIV